MNKMEISLETVYRWNCPVCGSVNISDPDNIDNLSEEDYESVVRELLELDSWQPIPDDVSKDDFVSMPKDVACSSCKTEFVVDYEEEDLE